MYSEALSFRKHINSYLDSQILFGTINLDKLVFIRVPMPKLIACIEFFRYISITKKKLCVKFNCFHSFVQYHIFIWGFPSLHVDWTSCRINHIEVVL